MTSNRFGNVVFEGVCTDYSNAAYPVDRVRGMVAEELDPRHRDPAIHIGLTLIDEGILDWNEERGSYVTSREMIDRAANSSSCNECSKTKPTKPSVSDHKQISTNSGTKSPEDNEPSKQDKPSKQELREVCCTSLDIVVVEEGGREDFLAFLNLLDSVVMALTRGQFSVF
ncbi:MAG: hypothetical protein ABEK59_09700 [Halobacteria archaeon]